MTQAGTSRVLDIEPGPGSSSPRDFLALGDQAFFTADQGGTGREPWRTDGTAGGTVRIADLNPGPTSGAGNIFPERLGEHVFFNGLGPVGGAELWRVPAAGPGAELVANIALGGSGSSTPRELSALTDRLLFTADDNIVGRELWVSNGNPGNFQLVEDFDGAATDSGVTFLTPFRGHVYFQVDGGDGNGTELWRSAGVPGDAEIVFDINPVGDSNPEDLRVAGDWLYFAATRPAEGREVWRTNGTTTELVADIDPAGSGPCAFPNFTAVGELVYFCAEDGTSGNELWRTDGTAAGTTRVADINPAGASAPDDLVVQDGEVLYFTADDGSSGNELWALDTAAPGTDVLAGPGPGEHVASSRPALRLNSRAVDLARYECSSGGPYVECAGLDGEGRSPQLQDGPRTLSVRAVDVRENPDPTPEQLDFVVDTKGPKVTIRGKRVSDRGGALRLKVKCKRSELSGPCRGKLVLKAAKGKGKVAKKKFRLKPGKSKRLKVRVKASKRPLLESGLVRVQGKARDRLGNKGKVARKKLRVG
jgi:ELWxxDGT repeat protein